MKRKSIFATRRPQRARYWFRKEYDAKGRCTGGDWVPFGSIASGKHKPKGDAPIVVRDIDPYRSIETGEVIGGRRQHRDHLRAHGMVEVGNERIDRKPVEAPPVAEDIKAALDKMGGLEEAPKTRDGWRDMIEKGRGRDVYEG